MKRLLFIACMACFVVSCNNKEEKSETTAADNTAAVKYDYPYTLEEPYKDWQPGDPQLAVAAMKALHAFETGKINDCVTFFGDSVDLKFDYYRAKLSNDSLKKYFTGARANYSSMTIKMGDWESVISKDKKTEYVTLWYKEIWTDTKGMTDSLGVIDDCRMVNGKIVELDEKIQHFPARK